MTSIFAQPSGSSLFGGNNNQQQNNTNPFGTAATNNNNEKPNLFGSLNTSTASQAPGGGGLFGSASATTSQAPSGTGLFGSTSQPQQSGGLFASTAQPQQSGGGLFGNLGASTNQQNQQNQQSSGGLFGNLGGSTSQQNQQPGGSILGTQQQQSNPAGGLFGGLGATNNQQNQSQQGGGLFGGFGQNTQQQQQQNQSQSQQQPTSLFGQTQGQPRLFVQSENGLTQKSVAGQMDLAFQRWNPQSENTVFSTYLYNNVPIEQAPFYGPTPKDDEAKWEEALTKKPRPGAVPILAQGFEELGHRMVMQYQALSTLQGRLHEINEGLNSLLQKHDLEISIRAAECRKKHLRISQQCLGLAAKTQILRNRGYAMDSAEEDLRKKLLQLERKVFDPALNGRGEEIWARMVSVRERGRQLHREFERAGIGLSQDNGKPFDEEVMAKTKKILEDYSSQLSHLTKELAQIQKDWADFESSKPPDFSTGLR